MNVAGLPSSVAAAGNRYTFSITTAANCAWTAATDVTWADVAPGSGQGNATPALTVAPHTERDARTLTVTINGLRIPITQHIVPCTYTLDRTAFDEGAQGGGIVVALTTLGGCAWTASASEGWIAVRTPSGAGSTAVTFELAPNLGDVRHAFLTVAGQQVNVTQQGR